MPTMLSAEQVFHEAPERTLLLQHCEACHTLNAIATAGGLVLLDLNAWPSFALYRDEAAPAIAAHLMRRFARGPA